MYAEADRPPYMPHVDEGPDHARFIRSIDLVALPSAVIVARLFVAQTLRLWRAGFMESDAELIATELVMYSVEASDPVDDWVYADHLDYIVLRLVGYEQSIVIEVWDTLTDSVGLPKHDQGDALHGLGLVDAWAKDWGSTVIARGRVVWAELDVYKRTSAGLPIRSRRGTPCPPLSTRAGELPTRDVEFSAAGARRLSTSVALHGGDGRQFPEQLDDSRESRPAKRARCQQPAPESTVTGPDNKHTDDLR